MCQPVEKEFRFPVKSSAEYLEEFLTNCANIVMSIMKMNRNLFDVLLIIKVKTYLNFAGIALNNMDI